MGHCHHVFVCVHWAILVEGQFISKSSTVHRSQVLPNSVIECPLFLFMIPLILAVGYQITIIVDGQVVNIFLRSWEVSFWEVILHIGTGVQWEVLISWLFFCLIVLLQNWFWGDCSVPEKIYALIHAHTYSQVRDVKLLNTFSGSSEMLLLWRDLYSGRGHC